jgi:Zn-dependent protease
MNILAHMAYVVLLGIPAMALHEGGHVLTALLCGIRVKRVGLCSKGLYTVREPGPRWLNVAVSAAGPLVNLVLAVALWNDMPTFAMVNVVACLYNLLPIANSDGTRILGLLKPASVLPHTFPQMRADM